MLTHKAFRLLAFVLAIAATACTSLPPSPIVAESNKIDRQLGGN
jgi:hypothetical protein